MAPRRLTPKERKISRQKRFWAKVAFGNSEHPNCWLWTAALMPNGYGYFGTWNGTTTVSSYAHRTSHELNVGPVPAGFCVLHHCDVRHCVRPDHLYLGTHQDNSNDMKRRGRSLKGYVRPRQHVHHGESHGASKLTLAQVREIRKRYRRGVYGYYRLARDYGVTPSTIYDIIVGRRWQFDH